MIPLREDKTTLAMSELERASLKGGRFAPDPGVMLVLDPGNDRWQRFAGDQPDRLVFHHPAWIQLLAETYGYRPFILAAADSSGAIQAGMPVIDVKSFLTGHRWVSLPYTDYTPPLYQDETSLAALLHWLVRQHQNDQAPRIEVRWDLPGQMAFQKDSRFVLQTIQIEPNIEAVAGRFSRENRQNIRKAEKQGVVIEAGTSVEFMRSYYQLQVETRHRQGVPVQPWRFFKGLAERLFPLGLGRVLLARAEGQIIAGMVLLHWGQSVIVKYAASRKDSQNLRPNNLLFWEGIQWASSNGYSLFDMGRTDVSNDGLRRYKKGWGAEEQDLTYSILSDQPVHSENGRFESLFQGIIQRSPQWACRLTGEILYKHYG